MNSPEPQVPGPPTWREYLDARLEPLATREALQDVRAELGRQIQDLRAELGREIQDVGAEVRGAKAEIIKWNVGTLIAAAALVWAIVGPLAA